MAKAWTARASASARRPAPRARAMAEAMPPPMAPADIICISMKAGEDEGHAGQGGGAEMADPVGLDEAGECLGDHDEHVRGSKAKQEREDGGLQQSERAGGMAGRRFRWSRGSRRGGWGGSRGERGVGHCVHMHLYGAMMEDHASPSVGRSEQPASGCHCAALRRAARRATGLYDAVMAPFGIRVSQFGILVRLRRSGPSSLQALAAELVLDRTTLGRNLRALERDGYVASEADPRDGRVRRLVITEAGVRLVRRAMPAWREAQTAFEQRYGAAPAAALLEALNRVTVALGQVTPAPE